MVENTYVICSQSLDPYHNLALEELLLEHAEPGQCILYLWQNAHTVVIGRNQNAYKECKVEQLAADGGLLARRLSGGGSVYHDMQNLNFTFLVHRSDYDVDRQLSVILNALETFGLHGEKSGRNDICIGGRKFSGNAFYLSPGCCYHHGTLLVDVDLNRMSQYLPVSAQKLKANSVSSVSSRVVNLKSLCPGIRVETLRAALVRAFEGVYLPAHLLTADRLDTARLAALKEKYAGDPWRYGSHMRADYTASQRFSWGEISILFQLQGHQIAGVQVYSDAMEQGISQVLTEHLKEIPFRREALQSAVLGAGGTLPPRICQDVADLLYHQEIW